MKQLAFTALLARRTVLFATLLAAVALCTPPTLAAQGSLPTYTMEQAASHVGEVASVEGTVAEVFQSNRGNVFLDFGARYPNQEFSAVIFRHDARKFANLRGLGGKRVRITGRITTYRGRPEIILNAPAQLQLEE